MEDLCIHSPQVCLSLEFLDSGDAICVYEKMLVKTRPDV